MRDDVRERYGGRTIVGACVARFVAVAVALGCVALVPAPPAAAAGTASRAQQEAREAREAHAKATAAQDTVAAAPGIPAPPAARGGTSGDGDHAPRSEEWQDAIEEARGTSPGDLLTLRGAAGLIGAAWLALLVRGRLTARRRRRDRPT